jgi:hypothetical protein
VSWFLRMDRAFQQTLMAWSVGNPVEIDDKTATMTSRQVGSHRGGWFGLQPLMKKIMAEQPDLFD